MVASFVTISLTAVAVAAQATTNLYESACSGELGQLYAFGGTNCQNLESDKRLSCQCDDPAFAESVVSCIDSVVSAVAPETTMNSSLSEAFNAFIKRCPKYSTQQLQSFYENSSELPTYDDTQKDNSKPGSWPVTNGAFAVSSFEALDAYEALVRSGSQISLNNRYGAILLGYWGCIAVIKAVLHFTSVLFSRQAETIMNSKIGRRWRAATLKDYRVAVMLGMTSMQFFIILGFIALAVVFTFADLPTHYPSYLYMNNDTATYSSVLGRRSGLLAVYIMPLFFLFAGRNNFLQWITGWPIGPFLLFHKWIARVAVMLLLVHAIAYSIASGAFGRYGQIWKQPFWQWGVVGLCFGFLLVVQALRYLRIRAYDAFVVLHILGAIMFLVSGYHHIRMLQIPSLLYFFYATFAVWGTDRVLRLARVLTSGFGQSAEIELKEDILIVSVKKPQHWQLNRNPGRYIFIHFWHFSLFWQSHPFTAVNCTEDVNHLKLFCKVHNGATRQIANNVLEESAQTMARDEDAQHLGHGEKLQKFQQLAAAFSSERRLTLQMRVLLDGPYGHSHDLTRFDECVFIVGGTGIAGPFDYIRQSLSQETGKFQKLRLCWAVRNSDEAERWFRCELEYLRRHSLVDVTIYSPSTKRLDIAGVVLSSTANSKGSVAIMSCGPPRMTREVRQAVANSIQATPNFVQYFEELICW